MVKTRRSKYIGHEIKQLKARANPWVLRMLRTKALCGLLHSSCPAWQFIVRFYVSALRLSTIVIKHYYELTTVETGKQLNS